MRCEGADNPPCRRCRHAGLECLFEKPSREPTLTGEAGLEYVSHAPISTTTDIYCSLSARRIKAIEASVADLRQTQIAIHQSLSELVQQLRTGSLNHGPNNVPPFRPSPGAYAGGSFSLSTSACTTPTGVDASSDLRHAVHSADGSGTYQGQNVLPPMMSNQQRQTPRPTAPSTAPYRSPSIGSGSRLSADTHPPTFASSKWRISDTDWDDVSPWSSGANAAANINIPRYWPAIIISECFLCQVSFRRYISSSTCYQIWT